MFKPLLLQALGLATAGTMAVGGATGALPNVLPTSGDQAVQSVSAGASQADPTDDLHGKSAEHRPGGSSFAGPTDHTPGGHGGQKEKERPAHQRGGEQDDDADGSADPDAGQRPHNHGFFVSEVARGITTTVPGVTFSQDPKNHGERVRDVAHSDAGKSQGASAAQGKAKQPK